jgi:hypothetical protein
MRTAEASGAALCQDGPVGTTDSAAGWVPFRRTDASVVIEMVRTVAESADPGEHGDGVEVVIETPRLGWLAGLLRDRVPDQARVVVTRAGGEVGYPFSVQIVSEHGGRAARLVSTPPGWATSDSAGLAFVIQKGRPGSRFDWGGLVGGAMAALCALQGDLPDDGWRAAVYRAVRRAQR